MCVCVCVCAWQWPIQHLFLKSDQQEKQTELFTRKRAVSYLLEGTEDICREERGGRKEREKEGGICGINNKSWKFRTARWRCGEDKAEQIIEACVCQEIYSVLTVKYNTVIPSVRRLTVSQATFVMSETETNSSE